MNTRKPTKKEVPDDALCWYWVQDIWTAGWVKRYGDDVRYRWQRGDRWLPYSAIPDPTNQPTTKGRKA